MGPSGYAMLEPNIGASELQASKRLYWNVALLANFSSSNVEISKMFDHSSYSWASKLGLKVRIGIGKVFFHELFTKQYIHLISLQNLHFIRRYTRIHAKMDCYSTILHHKTQENYCLILLKAQYFPSLTFATSLIKLL